MIEGDDLVFFIGLRRIVEESLLRNNAADPFTDKRWFRLAQVEQPAGSLINRGDLVTGVDGDEPFEHGFKQHALLDQQLRQLLRFHIQHLLFDMQREAAGAVEQKQ